MTLAEFEIEMGATPWHPSPAVEDREILERYDRPLTGIFQAGDVSYLYQCLVGRTADWSAWAYSPLSSEEVRQLVDETSDFEEALLSVLDDRSFLVVAATDEDGIVAVDVAEGFEDLGPVAHSLLTATRSDAMPRTSGWQSPVHSVVRRYNRSRALSGHDATGYVVATAVTATISEPAVAWATIELAEQPAATGVHT